MKKNEPMLQLAGRYADELTAQFRTLNIFVEHAGEIGRAHESYLRGIITRLLPKKFSVGTGFIICEEWTSSQQDIIIYNQYDFPTLFKVGDCVVVDYDSVAAVLEVKTRLKDKAEFREVYIKASELYRKMNHSRFVGLYIWEGLSLKSTLSVIWDYVRESPLVNLHNLPNAIYVRSKYLLLHNEDGTRETPPFRLLKISKDGITEGQALLTLMSEIWMGGVQKYTRWPRWLENWRRIASGSENPIPWTQDLQQIINDSLTNN